MQNFARQMAASIATVGEIAQPAAWAPISFIDTRDVARAAAAVLTDDGHDGRAYSLTGPQALTFERAAQTFAAVLDQPCAFVELSDEEARARMLARGLPEFYADALIEVSRAYRGRRRRDRDRGRGAAHRQAPDEPVDVRARLPARVRRGRLVSGH